MTAMHIYKKRNAAAALFLSFSVLLPTLLTGCSGQSSKTVSQDPVSRTDILFDTVVTITLYGDVLGATAFDGSANIDLVTSIGLALAPRPQAAAGLGQWMKVTCVMSFGKSIYSLPAGGSWAYYGLEILNKADGEGGFNGIASITAKIGIAAGGTALSNLYQGAGILEALCWRIA